MHQKRWRSIVLVALMLATACGSTAADTAEPVVSNVEADASAPETTAPTSSTSADSGPAQIDYEAYAADAQNAPTAQDDSSVPDIIPDAPLGAVGYSRYVYTQQDGDVVPVMVEGPLGAQVRCQDTADLCSFRELRELYQSGAEVPEYLDMTRDELATLVDQLNETEAAINEHNTLEEACAAGFSITSSQNPNMGIHVSNPNGTFDFDPSRPSMVLYAKDGGELLKRGDLGDCVDGEWTGEPGFESVGAVFMTGIAPEHPTGFEGPIDNWHVHYNTCASSPEEGGVSRLGSNGSRVLGSRSDCESRDGTFYDLIPVWMVHAYVDESHDADTGVFAMFNPTIWPLTDSASLGDAQVQQVDDASTSPISNFDFGNPTVKAGEPLVFTNADSVPHTVTASDGGFDSGVFGTGGSYELSFDSPGEYELFCVLHPSMTGVVTVE